MTSDTKGDLPRPTPIRRGGGLTVRQAVELWEDQATSRAIDVEARRLKARIREETAAKGVWPSDDGRNYVRQDNKLLIPASFSPLR